MKAYILGALVVTLGGSSVALAEEPWREEYRPDIREEAPDYRYGVREVPDYRVDDPDYRVDDPDYRVREPDYRWREPDSRYGARLRYVWIPGYWSYDYGHPCWIPGHYELRRDRYGWGWGRRHGRWPWRPGYWQRG